MLYDVTPITSKKQVDCGATCMKMLLAYYGHEISLNELIRACRTRIVGCSASDLLRVGKSNGLDMKAFKMSAAELVEQDRPAIIWWKYAHWCVFCGKDDQGRPVICNPDRGRYHVEHGTFSSLYSGVALFNGDPSTIA